jgi:hypothetical protein
VPNSKSWLGATDSKSSDILGITKKTALSLSAVFALIFLGTSLSPSASREPSTVNISLLTDDTTMSASRRPEWTLRLQAEGSGRRGRDENCRFSLSVKVFFSPGEVRRTLSLFWVAQAQAATAVTARCGVDGVDESCATAPSRYSMRMNACPFRSSIS